MALGTGRLAALLMTMAMVVVAAACGTPAGETADPLTAQPTAAVTDLPPASAAPSSDAAAFVLRLAPANLGCDSIGLDYRSVTFHIDPSAAEHVVAVTDQGKTLLTFWSDGFVPGTGGERAILDPSGAVVVTDGEVLAIPAAAWPRLQGYFVCPGMDALYVLSADPT